MNGDTTTVSRRAQTQDIYANIFFPVLPKPGNHWTISNKSKGAVGWWLMVWIHQAYFALHRTRYYSWCSWLETAIVSATADVIKDQSSSGEDLDWHRRNSSQKTIFKSNNFPIPTTSFQLLPFTTYHLLLCEDSGQSVTFSEINWFSQIFRTSPIILFTKLSSVKYRQNSEEILIYFLRSS